MLLPWSERALHRYVTSDEIPTWRCGWRKRSIIAACLWAVIEVIGMADLAAQETLRSSLSQQSVVQFQPDRPSAFVVPSSQLLQQFRQTLQPALLNLGPFRGQLTADLGVTYDDNANLTSTNQQSEVRFTESLGLIVNWPLSYLNQIGLQLGATLSEVVANNTRSFDISILPGTNVAFQFIVGDVLVGFHDFLTVLQDPTQDPAVSNQSALGRVTNDAGISAAWNLSRLILAGTFDYSYSSDESSTLSGGDRNTFRPSVSAAFALSPQVTTGLDVRYINSSSSGSSTLNAVSVGPFFRGQLTNAIAADLEGGLYSINASTTSSNGVIASNIPSTDYYLLFAVSHQLTHSIQYLASFSRDLSFSTGNDLSETNDFTLGVNWKLGRDFGVSVSGLADFGRVLSGQSPGSFTQYGGSLQFGWSPSRHIRAGISYEFLDRSGRGGSVPNGVGGISGSYKQNRVDLTVNYNF